MMKIFEMFVETFVGLGVICEKGLGVPDCEWPPHSNSHHQDYYIFSRGFL